MRIGTFVPVFEHCVSTQAGLERLHFNDLYDPSLLYFEDGSSDLYFHASGTGGQTLERKGLEVRKTIRCQSGGLIPGSLKANRWSQIRRREYGPP